MKKIISLLIFSISFCIITTGQMKDADAVVKELFEILKTKDEKRYAKLFPDYEGVKKIMSEMLSKSFSRQQIDSLFLNGFTEGEYTKKLSNVSEKFNIFLNENANKEIVWNSIIFKGYSVDTSYNGEDDSEMEFKTMRGSIDFLSDQKDYTVKFKEVVWSGSDKRWYGAEFKQVFEKGKEPSEGEFSTLSSSDTLRPAEYKPAKPKKVPVKKAAAKKPAAKSAALKPKQ